MNKKKRIIKHFTNWLFEEYGAPRIPVKVMHNVDFINDNGTDCFGYFGKDNGETVILIAAKRLGKLKCLFTIAHEFVHYMQQLNGRNMAETEIIEEDAYTFEKALVGKYLINKKHIGERIDHVLDISVPVRLLRMEGLDAVD